MLDYYAFAKANGDGADLIRLLSAYKTESNPVVWDALGTVFAAVHKVRCGACVQRCQQNLVA